MESTKRAAIQDAETEHTNESTSPFVTLATFQS